PLDRAPVHRGPARQGERPSLVALEPVQHPPAPRGPDREARGDRRLPPDAPLRRHRRGDRPCDITRTDSTESPRTNSVWRPGPVRAYRGRMTTAIVTGASRGLGLALGRALHERGWSLVVDARGEAELRRAWAGVPGVTALAGDVTDAEHRLELVM